MSDRAKAIVGACIFGIFLSVVMNSVIDGGKFKAIETSVTALEKSQCVAKDSKVHADVKFEACMKQFKGKKP